MHSIHICKRDLIKIALCKLRLLKKLLVESARPAGHLGTKKKFAKLIIRGAAHCVLTYLHVQEFACFTCSEVGMWYMLLSPSSNIMNI